MRMLSYTARVRSMRTWDCASLLKPRVVPPRTILRTFLGEDCTLLTTTTTTTTTATTTTTTTTTTTDDDSNNDDDGLLMIMMVMGIRMIMKGCGEGLRAAAGGDLAPNPRGRRIISYLLTIRANAVGHIFPRS